jgi:Cu2+-exporting ATPase/Cu+-exporting ATPase
MATIDTLVFDKTGTLTTGHPVVTDVLAIEKNITTDDVLQLAASLEQFSNHPLAQTIVAAAKTKNLPLLNTTDYQETTGIGVQGLIKKNQITIRRPLENEYRQPQLQQLQQQAKTVVVVEKETKLIGVLGVSDTLKPGAKPAIKRLQQQGIETLLLTGDNQTTADQIAKQVGITTVHANLLPTDKTAIIKTLQQQGKRVAMAGDGINDAPALTQATVGIAMATGTDIAIESAGITLLHGDIEKLAQLVTLSRATIRIIKQNLFWAFIYNLVGIPLAAGVFYPLFGILLNPVFAGLAMAGSSVSVVTNSLRLQAKQLK